MGYRGQQNREDAEEARYRAEVPRHVRAWHRLRACLIVFGPVVVAIAIAWWRNR